MRRDRLRELALAYLERLLRRQQHPKPPSRGHPFLLLDLVDWAFRQGAKIDHAYGPWRVKRRPLDRPGRYGLSFIPVVKGRVSEIMLDTMGQAVRLAGFLNWCDVADPLPRG
jgi:hypothetical protein